MPNKNRADRGFTLHPRWIKTLSKKGESGEGGKNILDTLIQTYTKTGNQLSLFATSYELSCQFPVNRLINNEALFKFRTRKALELNYL